MMTIKATIKEAAAQVNTSPTDPQADAGNYRKGHISLHGLQISIENPKGSRRRPEWPKLSCHYGYIKRTTGADNDHVDVFIGPVPESELVVIVDQVGPDGKWDEHKCLIGFTSKKAARSAYLANYTTKGWKVGPVTSMTIDQFKAWLAKGSQRKEVSKQVSRYQKGKTIAVDFDGTLVESLEDFDETKAGKVRPGAAKALSKWKDDGHTIIIHTVRGNTEFVSSFLKEHGIPFDHINENPNQPEGASDKPIADVYLDDKAISAQESWDRLGPQVDEFIAKYEADWRTIGGGAPALVDLDSGSILAGCPGLEGEDLDDIGEGESPESRDRRDEKQDTAEEQGWVSEEDQRAREAWEEAKKGAPVGSIVVLRLGDTFHSFGEDASILEGELGVGDGEIAQFDASDLDKHVGDLQSVGFNVVIAERTEDGGATITGQETPAREPEIPTVDNPASVNGEKAYKFGSQWFYSPGERAGWLVASPAKVKEIEAGLGIGQPEQAPAPEPEQGRTGGRYNQQIADALGPELLGEEGLREAFENELEQRWKAKHEQAASINEGLSQILTNFGYNTPRKQNGLMMALRKSERDVASTTVRGRRIFDEMAQIAESHAPHVIISNDEGDREGGFFERLQRGFEPDPGEPSKKKVIPAGLLDETLDWLETQLPAANEFDFPEPAEDWETVPFRKRGLREKLRRRRAMRRLTRLNQIVTI